MTMDKEIFQLEAMFQVSNSSLLKGYSGYVPAVKSENVFGSTFGKTSFKSATGDYHRGID
jgi:hypothetical protein